MTTPNLDLVEYRVLLVDPVSRGVLVQSDRGSFRLLRLTIPSGSRIARQLHLELQRRWGIAMIILDLLSVGCHSPCVLAELLMGSAPDALHVVGAEQIREDELAEGERAQLLRVLADDVACPFSRIGWMDEALDWVEEVTSLRPHKATLEQHNAGGGFSLLHLPKEDGRSSYWFKATGPPNIHERRVTCLLSRLSDDCLPGVVAEKPDWNAWLMTGNAVSISTLPSEPDELVRVLARAMRSLAEIQMKTVGMEPALLDAGAFDQRVPILQAAAGDLFTYIAESMAFQTSTKVPRIDTSRLEQIRNLFERMCDRIESLDMPATILHGDINLGNLLFTDAKCQIIDWCEAYIGHPLVAFQHLLLLNPLQIPTVRVSVEESLKKGYLTAMSMICDPRTTEEGFAYMPLLAAVSALYGRGDWLSMDLRSEPGRYEYARRIARHMDRATHETAFVKAMIA